MAHGLHSIALRYFVEVANCGSVSEASERLHVATSAISRQIAKLEDEVHAPLFDRQTRGMVLSEAGKVLWNYARRSLLDAEQIMRDIDVATNSRATMVRVVCSEGFSNDFLPSLIHSFRQGHPLTHFRVSVTSPTDATQKVRSGEADIALTFSLASETGVKTLYSTRAPLYALLRSDHPLAGNAHLTLEDLNRFDHVLSEVGTTSRTLLDLAAGIEGVELSPTLTSNNNRTLYRYAQISGAIMFAGFVTFYGEYREDGFVAVPLSGSWQQRRIEVQTMLGRTLPTTVQCFADSLISELEKIQEQQSAQPPAI